MEKPLVLIVGSRTMNVSLQIEEAKTQTPAFMMSTSVKDEHTLVNMKVNKLYN
jgi:hypothetical protein